LLVEEGERAALNFQRKGFEIVRQDQVRDPSPTNRAVSIRCRIFSVMSELGSKCVGSGFPRDVRYSTCRLKWHSTSRLKWPWLDIEATLTLVRSRSGYVRDISVLIHEAALALARDHSVAFYDALIVAAALEASCDTLFTEDMQHGRKLGGLTIINPFIESAP
jgi:PIN domain